MSLRDTTHTQFNKESKLIYKINGDKSEDLSIKSWKQVKLSPDKPPCKYIIMNGSKGISKKSEVDKKSRRV